MQQGRRGIGREEPRHELVAQLDACLDVTIHEVGTPMVLPLHERAGELDLKRSVRVVPLGAIAIPVPGDLPAPVCDLDVEHLDRSVSAEVLSPVPQVGTEARIGHFARLIRPRSQPKNIASPSGVRRYRLASCAPSRGSISWVSQPRSSIVRNDRYTCVIEVFARMNRPAASMNRCSS